MGTRMGFIIKLAVILSLMISGFAEENRFLKSKKENPNLIAFGAGVYDLFRYNHRYITGFLQIEYKGPDFFGKNLLKVRPFAALMGNFQGSVWIGGGVNFDIIATKPIIITLGFGPGFFYRGHGKDLGYPLEMRSSIELAYQFKSYSRLGFQFYHLSNASLSLRRNPGTECLVLFYAIPI